MIQFHLIQKQTPSGRWSLVLCGIPIVEHESQEVIARLHDTFRVTQGLPPLSPKPPRGFKTHSDYSVTPTFAVTAEGVFLDHDIAALLPFLPRLTFTNGYPTVKFTGVLRKEKFEIRVYLHNIALGPRVKFISEDHKDCRRINLRGAQDSNYRGVARNHGKWKAQLSHDGTVTYLGTYATQEEAAKAYDKAAGQRFGEYAHLNFPQTPIFLRGVATKCGKL